MTPNSPSPSDNSADREIVITRLLNAPRELVFEAWTDPKHLDKWMGPRGFQTTTRSVEVKVGGMWRYVMRGPDGTDYDNRVVYTEITKPSRIVYEHGHDKDNDPERFHVTVTFEEEAGGKTKLTLRTRFATPEQRAASAKFGAIELGHQTIDRLEERVAYIALDDHPFTIVREFKAPRELVFKAWTEADRLAKWWGPKGCKVDIKCLDLQPGGNFHYSMRMEDGMSLWGKFTFREIHAPERLIYLNHFADADGNTARCPWDANWPLDILSVVTFEEISGSTRVTIHNVPMNAAEAERATFNGMRESMTMGWGGSLEQLAVYLAG